MLKVPCLGGLSSLLRHCPPSQVSSELCKVSSAEGQEISFEDKYLEYFINASQILQFEFENFRPHGIRLNISIHKTTEAY